MLRIGNALRRKNVFAPMVALLSSAAILASFCGVQTAKAANAGEDGYMSLHQYVAPTEIEGVFRVTQTMMPEFDFTPLQVTFILDHSSAIPGKSGEHGQYHEWIRTAVKQVFTDILGDPEVNPAYDKTFINIVSFGGTNHAGNNPDKAAYSLTSIYDPSYNVTNQGPWNATWQDTTAHPSSIPMMTGSAGSLTVNQRLLDVMDQYALDFYVNRVSGGTLASDNQLTTVNGFGDIPTAQGSGSFLGAGEKQAYDDLDHFLNNYANTSIYNSPTSIAGYAKEDIRKFVILLSTGADGIDDYMPDTHTYATALKAPSTVSVEAWNQGQTTTGPTTRSGLNADFWTLLVSNERTSPDSAASNGKPIHLDAWPEMFFHWISDGTSVDIVSSNGPSGSGTPKAKNLLPYMDANIAYLAALPGTGWQSTAGRHADTPSVVATYLITPNMRMQLRYGLGDPTVAGNIKNYNNNLYWVHATGSSWQTPAVPTWAPDEATPKAYWRYSEWPDMPTNEIMVHTDGVDSMGLANLYPSYYYMWSPRTGKNLAELTMASLAAPLDYSALASSSILTSSPGNINVDTLVKAGMPLNELYVKDSGSAWALTSTVPAPLSVERNSGKTPATPPSYRLFEDWLLDFYYPFVLRSGPDGSAHSDFWAAGANPVTGENDVQWYARSLEQGTERSETSYYYCDDANAVVNAFNLFSSTAAKFVSNVKAKTVISQYYDLYKFPGKPLLETQGPGAGTATVVNGKNIVWTPTQVQPNKEISLTFYVKIDSDLNGSSFYPVTDSATVSYEMTKDGTTTAYSSDFADIYTTGTGETKTDDKAANTAVASAEPTTKENSGGLIPIVGARGNNGLPYTPSVTPSKNVIENEQLQEKAEDVPVTSDSDTLPKVIALLAMIVAVTIGVQFTFRKRKSDQRK